jgi:RNA polymerase sigma factor (TIGR02999 family)
MGQVTQLLRARDAGDREAFDRLVPLVYDELRRIARRQLRRRSPQQTLDSSGLVHEAWLKLAGAQRLRVNDHPHFLAVAATAMRQVLIDRARGRLRVKRGAGTATASLDGVGGAGDATDPEWLLDVDRALDALGRREPRLARVFECRFFAGLSEDETATALGLSLRSVQRDWMRSRAWLRAALEGEAGALS